MRDHIIREFFHKSVLQSAHHDVETQVVDEFGLKNGEVRADIAVFNGKLVGYEIKTENDNLTRLASQVIAYSEVFEQAFLIVSKNHLSKALDIIPSWWGIYTIEPAENGSYSFLIARKAKLNKSLNTYALAQLLWKAEAFEVANFHLKHSISPRITKHEIYDIISGTCASKKLSKIVLRYLKQRENWRTNQR